METYSSITSSITSSGSRSNGSPNPPPPAEGRLKLSPSSTFKLEKNAPRNFSLSVPGLSQFPCGFDGSPPKIPQVTERERSQHTDITVSVTFVRVPPFSIPQPPRYFPGPPESGIISCFEVTTGVSLSCPSHGCTLNPAPKTGDIAFAPSRSLLPPCPPAIQSYHIKKLSYLLLVSQPPISKYSKLKEQASALSGTTCDHNSKQAFIIFS